jgi:hypothetical protein
MAIHGISKSTSPAEISMRLPIQLDLQNPLQHPAGVVPLLTELNEQSFNKSHIFLPGAQATIRFRDVCHAQKRDADAPLHPPKKAAKAGIRPLPYGLSF